jgi:hypothetical protein
MDLRREWVDLGRCSPEVEAFLNENYPRPDSEKCAEEIIGIIKSCATMAEREEFIKGYSYSIATCLALLYEDHIKFKEQYGSNKTNPAQ